MAAIAVAIASFRPRRLLEACLASLGEPCRAHGASIVVARDAACGDLAQLAADHPQVRFVAAPAGAGIPRLRALALAQAEGDWVALTEDHCVAAPDWIARLLEAAADDVQVLGGAMDNAQRRRAVDWGAFFSEYGFFAEGGGRGALPLITGANVAYRRDVVAEVVRLAGAGEWENVVHAQLAGAGRRLRFAPAARVLQNLSYRLADFCADRYRHGHDYARRRLVDEPGRRWLYLPGTLVLPLLQLVRVGRCVGPRNRLAFVRAAPVTLLFLAAWSFGEAVGYWRGAVPDASPAEAQP